MPASDRQLPDNAAFPSKRTDNQRALGRIRDFMAVVSGIEADTTRSAQSRARAISEQYARSLDDLAGSGDLTDRVQKQLEEQTRWALAHLGQMSEEFGDQLDKVARAYRAPESQALAARVVGFSAISLVVFLVLIALGVGPMGVLLVILIVGGIAALKLSIDREDGA